MIREYCSTGGLIVLMQLIINYFTQFLQHTTRLVARFGWERGPAQPTLAYYCEKLLKIRTSSTNKLMMYLRFYVWLRDATAKKFTDSNLQKYIWHQMNQISRLPPSNTSEGINNDEQPHRVSQRRTCKICGSGTIHSKIRPLSSWSTCPFSSASDKRLAHKARGLVNVHMQENDLDHTDIEVVRQKIEEAKNS